VSDREQLPEDDDAWTGSLIPPEVLAAIRQAEAESDATIAAIARLEDGPADEAREDRAYWQQKYDRPKP
jgi:hypothetical protein